MKTFITIFAVVIAILLPGCGPKQDNSNNDASFDLGVILGCMIEGNHYWTNVEDLTATARTERNAIMDRIKHNLPIDNLVTKLGPDKRWQVAPGTRWLLDTNGLIIWTTNQFEYNYVVVELEEGYRKNDFALRYQFSGTNITNVVFSERYMGTIRVGTNFYRIGDLHP